MDTFRLGKPSNRTNQGIEIWRERRVERQKTRFCLREKKTWNKTVDEKNLKRGFWN